MIQQQFANQAVSKLTDDVAVVGLAAGGSWITNKLDAFSDLDLILVTTETVSGNRDKMLFYATRMGKLLTGFTGEHVGEPRLLICLFDDPLLHVDIKFLTVNELHTRVEDPVILLDKSGSIRKAIESSKPVFPLPDYQWLEDRFWIWVHYALLKIGRGEYLEALDFFSYIRTTVLGPLLHLKNGNLPRGVRKVETSIAEKDLEQLITTVPVYSRTSLLDRLENIINLYRHLRLSLFPSNTILQSDTETRVMTYYKEISNI